MDVIQLNIAVTGPCRESKGLAFVLAMQSLEGFAAAAMDNAAQNVSGQGRPLYQALSLKFYTVV
jgi:hypothetical protein